MCKYSCKNSIEDISEEISSFTIENREILTSKQAADHLGISLSRLHNLTSSGKVPYYKFYKSNRYLKSELTNILLANPKGMRNEH